MRRANVKVTMPHALFFFQLAENHFEKRSSFFQPRFG